MGDGFTKSVRITKRSQAVRFSLGTSDQRLAERRRNAADTFLEAYFAGLDAVPTYRLSHRNVHALAGELYAAWAEEPDALPAAHLRPNLPYLPEVSPPEDYEEEARSLGRLANLVAALEDEENMEAGFGACASAMLATHGVFAIRGEDRARLLPLLRSTFEHAIRVRARRARGDYSPDENAGRFPHWELPEQIAAPPPVRRSSRGLSLGRLVEMWWAEARAAGGSEATYAIYAARFKALTEFLGHDDAHMVKQSDLVRCKDHRLSTINPKTGRPVSAQTIRTGDLAGFRSVFGWGVENGLLMTNPAMGLKVKAGRKVKLRERDFTEEEARTLLCAANRVLLTRRSPQFDYLKRWAPWLLAYSGARVGEVVQLRKQDFRKVDTPVSAWVMTITPEAGTVKDKQLREIPLHPHLIELGFAEFLAGAAEGYLFITVMEGKPWRNAWRGAKSRLAAWVREHVTDPNVAPNHGWRHTFKSIGFEAGIQEKVLDALCGHAPKTQGRAYGSVTLRTKVDAMATFPRYIV